MKIVKTALIGRPDAGIATAEKIHDLSRERLKICIQTPKPRRKNPNANRAVSCFSFEI